MEEWAKINQSINQSGRQADQWAWPCHIRTDPDKAGHAVLLMHKRWGRNRITVLTSFFSHFANHNKEAQWKCNTNSYICSVKPREGLWYFTKKMNSLTQNQGECDLYSHVHPSLFSAGIYLNQGWTTCLRKSVIFLLITEPYIPTYTSYHCLN